MSFIINHELDKITCTCGKEFDSQEFQEHIKENKFNNNGIMLKIIIHISLNTII